MQRLRFILTSSIGKKELMALTGLAFIGFLVIHLIGNLTIYLGSETFNAYAHTLHSLGPLVEVFEFGLLTIGGIHIVFAMMLIFQNQAARPVDYAGKRAEGGRSLGSRTMIFSGPYILLFVVFHLIHFVLIDKTGTTIAAIVGARFHDPLWVAFYSFSMLVVGTHVSHGLWSGFQSMGVSTTRDGALRRFSSVLSWVFALGFGLIPLAVYFAAEKIKFN